MDSLTLSILPGRLAVCRLPPDALVPERPVSACFWSVTRSDDELSLVLPEETAPAGSVVEPGWRCLKVRGPLDFGLTGILASLASPLAEAGVSIFALSTYDTDYILIKENDLEKTKQVLTANGHTIV